ncbi:MAG: glycosyltransferase family 2 protein [Candidatus Omnitrophota bacterium]|nr:glycosyltransferase family 2 protein [Candidatus Omnitrophota bacterium]
MKTCIIIPAYNESKEIARLIRAIRQQNLDVLVMDDGSSDRTSFIAQNSGANVLRNWNNKGKGASLMRGFNYALANEYDAVITMDGDGQHRPQDLPYFIRLAKYSDTGILIGNRMKKAGNMPLIRFLTNRLMSWFISCLAKQKIPDTQCGFRLIKKEVLRKLKLTTSKYETESEVLIKAGRLGFKIKSVPIKTIYFGEKSQINPFLDTLRFIRFIVKEICNMDA